MWSADATFMHYEVSTLIKYLLLTFILQKDICYQREVLPMARVDRNPDFLDRIERFRLFVDTFKSVIFDDREYAEFLIRQILDDSSPKVVSVTAQKEMKNLNGRLIRLDIHAIDSNGKAYDIEVERSDSRATPKRTRYNASIMDLYITEPGDDYENLPESYVVFVTENDVWKGNLPVYTANRKSKNLITFLLMMSRISYL